MMFWIILRRKVITNMCKQVCLIFMRKLSHYWEIANYWWMTVIFLFHSMWVTFTYFTSLSPNRKITCRLHYLQQNLKTGGIVRVSNSMWRSIQQVWLITFVILIIHITAIITYWKRIIAWVIANHKCHRHSKMEYMTKNQDRKTNKIH